MAKLEPKDKLRYARLNKHLSRERVAEQIGTSSFTIGRWERGETSPQSHFIDKLCTFFQMKPDELGFAPTVSPNQERRQNGPKPPSLRKRKRAQESSQKVTASEADVSGQALYDPAIPLQPAIHLVGRDKILSELKQRLCADRGVSMTALNGLPGVGKTALSVALAHDHQIRAYFCDGILWAGLGPDPNIAGLLSRWGKLLGLSATEMSTLNSSEDWAKALRNAIGLRRMLLVLDDAWQVEEALALKVGGTNCTHLVTTRFPTIAAHIAADGAIQIQELSDEESMTLLRLLAPNVVEHEVKKAYDLVQAVGGLPLALTLIGKYLRMQAYSGHTRRIHAALERLSDAEERLQISELRGPVEIHPSLPADMPLSLQSIIAVTDQQLDEPVRAALYALSVFPAKPNNFSEEAALTVAACSVETLDALIDAGLLESSGTDRYTLHQTIADYARAHLKESTVHERLMTYFTNYVEKHKADYEMLDQESGTILAVLEMAHVSGKQSALIRGVSAFAPFLVLRGAYALAERHLQRMHEVATAMGDQHGLTSALLYLGEVAQKQGHYQQAEASFQEGLMLARQLGDNDRISALLTDLGWVTMKRGEYPQAEAYLQEGLTLARQLGQRERISGLLQVLGSVAAGWGKYSQAEAYLQEGLALARQSGDREQICVLLINLGVTVAEQGRDKQARTYLLEGLTLARQIGHREWISLLLLNLGGAAMERGDYPQAETYFQEGLELARRIGHREWISILLLNLGQTAQKREDAVQAEVYFQEALTLAQQIGRSQITASVLYEYGNFYIQQQKIEAAEASFREMLTIIPKGNQELLTLAQYGQARITASRGNIHEARMLGEASANALETMGHHKAPEVRNWLNSLANETPKRGEEKH